ncbi:hypothetical protein BM613_02640 [Sulfoacidibacillus thermotolerans]|uniref:Peptide ABC transporter permease n=2 Tax=Sulfoacidibacillus thermotolerans TaxID=1765684 RepID=A0A2U3DB00_SULT2|nr:hypothetical protein BM613_02640 [Sulfoacidibacillus thermotolerans]
MKMVYYCKYCNSVLGQIEANPSELDHLGFWILTPEERADIISVNEVLHTAYVKTVCEYCETALRDNPQLFLAHTPLQ